MQGMTIEKTEHLMQVFSAFNIYYSENEKIGKFQPTRSRGRLLSVSKVNEDG